ncbi:hypothetical protein pb186bvf_005811 [Paramecium bursaria]
MFSKKYNIFLFKHYQTNQVYRFILFFDKIVQISQNKKNITQKVVLLFVKNSFNYSNVSKFYQPIFYFYIKIRYDFMHIKQIPMNSQLFLTILTILLMVIILELCPRKKIQIPQNSRFCDYESWPLICESELTKQNKESQVSKEIEIQLNSRDQSKTNALRNNYNSNDAEYLKKLIRDFKNIQEYQDEYNLDDSQLLLNQIKHFVPIRGDGNSMFTSLGLQYLYFNLIDAQRYQGLLNLIDQTEFKQNLEDQSVETEEDQDILRQEFKFQLERLKEFKDHQLLQAIADNINNAEGPFYGLLIIFMRNYFRKILQEFYDNSEMNFLIQEPDQINEIITWGFMYNEAQIALKLFATKEQILILGYQKLNVEDKTVQIEEYKDDNASHFNYKIGLAFHPGHYDAILLKQ